MTPADCIGVIMAAESFRSTYLQKSEQAVTVVGDPDAGRTAGDIRGDVASVHPSLYFTLSIVMRERTRFVWKMKRSLCITLYKSISSRD